MLAISKKQFAMLFSLQKVWVKKHGNKKLVVLFALFLYVHPITFEIKWTILIVRLSLSYSFPLKHRLQKFIGSKKYKLENNLVQLQNFH